MPKQQMVSGTQGAGMLLKTRCFEVPRHQRDYSWPVGAVEQYLDDVLDAMRRGDSEYFLGTIVLVDTDDHTSQRYEIIDGQQRLATTTMIFSAIRHWLKNNNQDQDADDIQNSFIGIRELGKKEHEPRLIMNVRNRHLFQELVVSQCSDSILAAKQKEYGRHTSQRKLVDATIYCRKKIAELAESRGQNVEKQGEALIQLAIYLRNNVQVNCLDVTSPENAYVIFESLNDRGIDLSVLDLLKNHVFRLAGTYHLQEVEHNWTIMMSGLGDCRADDFLKAFWTSRFGRVQRGMLFRRLKEQFAGQKDVLTLSKELSKLAETFANLDVSDSELWQRCSVSARTSVQALATLGSLQTYPIILAALARFEPKQIERLLRYLVTLIVRYQVVGRGRTGKLEITAASVASSIYNKRLTTPGKVWEALRHIVPDDDEFEEDFLRYSEPKGARARYFLRELEIRHWQECNPGKPVQYVPETNPEKVTLEHILPKNPDQSWSLVTKADQALMTECGERLGNLCLLDRPSNKQQSSKAFNEKVKTYKKSDFLLTRKLSQYDIWNRASIEDRQRKLAKLAIATWPL